MKDPQETNNSIPLKEFLNYRFKELEGKIDSLSTMLQNNYATKEAVSSVDGRVKVVEESQVWIVRSVLGTAISVLVSIGVAVFLATKGLK